MASRIPRLPRLTLFSGPSCSLCDTAKEELAKVRLSRPFQLTTINIHDPGQERWKNKYVYWIPALHLDGKEIAKGRWDAHTSSVAGDSEGQVESELFVVDTSPSHYSLDNYGVYIRSITAVLGEEQYNNPSNDKQNPKILSEDDEDIEDLFSPNRTKRCFNCGSPEHPYTACSEPLNRDLVALTRALFQFSNGTIGLANWKRIHNAEEWRKQRLEWADHFSPGTVVSPLLQEATGSSEGDGGWLRNMALWGYPPGWVAREDPRVKVRERIESEHGCDMSWLEEDAPFCIFESGGEVEEMDLSFNADEEGSESDSTSSDSPLIRWAQYPTTHFSSSLLPVYVGNALPSLHSPPHPTLPQNYSATYTSERDQLWERILSGNLPPPPPPVDAPPPLPPSPPSYAPPSLPSQPLSTFHHPRPPPPTEDDDGGSDMDLSDSDSS